MPVADLEASLDCLDDRRLGKQRVEAWQIIRILLGLQRGNAWRRHPAVLMWAGHEPALARYIGLSVRLWGERGFRNVKMLGAVSFLSRKMRGQRVRMPGWMGWSELHASHRANLLRKKPLHYVRFGWTERPAKGYVWPVARSGVEVWRLAA